MNQFSTELETLVVGIDGACERVLDPLFAAGELPTLARIFEDGTAGTLESQIPPWTPSAWPSLYTGTNPGKHGVFGFLDFEDYDWSVVNASDVQERTLWEYADLHDLTSVVVNAPVTYPPPEIDGAVVPGYLAPENPQCHPAGLLDDIKDAIGGYSVYASLESENEASTEERVAEYREHARMRGAAFRYLADRFEPAFGFLQFQHTDTILHECPDDWEAVAAVYGAVDRQVGEILDACDPDTVFVVSDHGLGPYEQRVRINDVLRDVGYVSAARGGDGMPSWASIRDEQLKDGGPGTRRDRNWIEQAMAVGAAIGLTTQRVGGVLERAGLRDIVERHVPVSVIRAASEQVDFARSKAYARSRVECGIRINLEGREPEGVVSPEEYDAVREDIITQLSALESPTGEPVFEEVGFREEYFHGPQADRAVDVVAVPRDFDYSVTTWLMGDHFADPEPPGWDHKRDGVLAAVGDGIDTATNPTDAHIFDVAPTVLATLGIRRNERMDGKTLPFVDNPGEKSYPSFEPESEATVDDPDVEAQLADLGYLD